MIGKSTTYFHHDKKYERLIVGYTANNHLLLDLDRIRSPYKVSCLVRSIQKEYPYVGDCLVVQSSFNNFHVIFDSVISWKKITDIVITLAHLKLLDPDYMQIRSFRHDLTLRVSSIDRGHYGSDAPLPIGLILIDKNTPFFGEWLKTLTWGELLKNEENYFKGVQWYLNALLAYQPISHLKIRVLLQ